MTLVAIGFIIGVLSNLIGFAPHTWHFLGKPLYKWSGKLSLIGLFVFILGFLFMLFRGWLVRGGI